MYKPETSANPTYATRPSSPLSKEDEQQRKDARVTYAPHSTVGADRNAFAKPTSLGTGTEELVLGQCLCPKAMRQTKGGGGSEAGLMNPQSPSRDVDCHLPISSRACRTGKRMV